MYTAVNVAGNGPDVDIGSSVAYAYIYICYICAYTYTRNINFTITQFEIQACARAALAWAGIASCEIIVNINISMYCIRTIASSYSNMYWDIIGMVYCVLYMSFIVFGLYQYPCVEVHSFIATVCPEIYCI